MSIPVTILAACAGLFLLFGIFLARMLKEAGRTQNALRRLEHIFRSVAAEDGESRRHGLASISLTKLHERCGQLKDPMRIWWGRIEDNLLCYSGQDGHEGWYLGASP